MPTDDARHPARVMWRATAGALRSAALAVVMAASAAAQEAWELYHAPEADGAALAEQIQTLLPPDVRLRLRPLSAEHGSKQDEQRHEHAIAAGVRSLPCLVLRDAAGAYATLPLQGLTAGRIAQARELAHAPTREAEARKRRLVARLYRLRLAWLRCEDDAARDSVIGHYRSMMKKPEVDEELRQFIGLHCLYPALMHCYAMAYQGAHTPRSEALLLEAIRVLEEVRDAKPTSYWGRRAYEEREKLRAARLKSRQYE